MKEFGLVGKTLTHSFSQKYFTEKFEKEHIPNSNYSLFPLDSIQEIGELIATPNLSGLNVTIPYKESVIQFLDSLDEAAKNIGAVNTIVFKNGKTIGYNTDVIGFQNSIKPFLTNKHERALILGTGGGAKAIRYVLENIGITCLTVSRNPKEGEANYSNLSPKLLSFYKLIVNCTPLGTFPNVDEAPNLPYEALDEEHLLYDLVYNPPLTKFMQLGKENGATVLNGYDMLVGQAEAAWKLWNK
jgi:shikimate dehydrogenase